MENLTIAQLIQSGAHDADLDAIENAVKNRRDIQQMNMRYTLTPCQEVWFNDKVNPRYLRGRRCIIQEINRVRAKIRLVNPSPRNRYQGDISVTIDLITTTKPTYAID